jgi:hypothetical protein
MVNITVHPKEIARAVLSPVDTVVAGRQSPESSESLGQPPPTLNSISLEPSEALFWPRKTGEAPFRLRIAPNRAERRRHRRKYAEGELFEEKVFYFRGAERKLSLRAQNLIAFTQIADGLDDVIWTYHLKRGDYCRRFREAIRDDALAAEATCVQRQTDVSLRESRR